MKKTFLLFTSSISVIITGAIVWPVVNFFIDSQIEDRNTNEVIEKTHGREAVLSSETNADFVNGHSY